MLLLGSSNIESGTPFEIYPINWNWGDYNSSLTFEDDGYYYAVLPSGKPGGFLFGYTKENTVEILVVGGGGAGGGNDGGGGGAGAVHLTSWDFPSLTSTAGVGTASEPRQFKVTPGGGAVYSSSGPNPTAGQSQLVYYRFGDNAVIAKTSRGGSRGAHMVSGFEVGPVSYGGSGGGGSGLNPSYINGSQAEYSGGVYGLTNDGGDGSYTSPNYPSGGGGGALGVGTTSNGGVGYVFASGSGYAAALGTQEIAGGGGGGGAQTGGSGASGGGNGGGLNVAGANASSWGSGGGGGGANAAGGNGYKGVVVIKYRRF